MCGRFVRYSNLERFAELFEAVGSPGPVASYNIAPGSKILLARNRPDGSREMVMLKWGLVPSWSDEPKTEYSTINARAETVAEKPAYRSAFKHRRCLIAADGFYEWHSKSDGHKQPYFIQLANGEPFALAGIWEHWQRDEKVLETCSIIVTTANELMKPIHDRMPVILMPENYDDWLNATEAEAVKPLMKPFPSSLMKLHPVSTAVNSPRNDGADLLQPTL